MSDLWDTIRWGDWVTITAPDGTTYRGQVELAQMDRVPGMGIVPDEGPPTSVADHTTTTYTIRIPDPQGPPEPEAPPVPRHIARAHRHVTRKDPHE